MWGSYCALNTVSTSTTPNPNASTVTFDGNIPVAKDSNSNYKYIVLCGLDKYNYNSKFVETTGKANVDIGDGCSYSSNQSNALV